MRLDTGELQRNINFLNNSAQLMRDWSDRKYSLNTKFTLVTIKAVQLTSSTIIAKTVPGLLSFSKKQSLGIDYICTARLNSDHEEGAFGRRRQMSDTNYWTKARQFFKAESIVRIQSLVRLSEYALKDIKLMMTYSVRILCWS